MTNFDKMTDVIPYIVKKALPELTLKSCEGMDYIQIKDNFSINTNEYAVVNLLSFPKKEEYTDNGSILAINYEIYIFTARETADTIIKLNTEIKNYNSKCTVTINGNKYLIVVADIDSSIFFDNQKIIRYNVEIYV